MRFCFRNPPCPYHHISPLPKTSKNISNCYMSITVERSKVFGCIKGRRSFRGIYISIYFLLFLLRKVCGSGMGAVRKCGSVWQTQLAEITLWKLDNTSFHTNTPSCPPFFAQDMLDDISRAGEDIEETFLSLCQLDLPSFVHLLVMVSFHNFLWIKPK